MAIKNMKSVNRNSAPDETVFVDGNTLRTAAAAPSLQRAPRRVSKMAAANRERSLRMNLTYVTFLAVTAVLSVFVCVTYLRLQANYTALQKQTTALESSLASLKLDNDAEYNRIVSSVNLDEIKDKAMNKFGMVYASAGQVVTYEAPGSDYVKQYTDVPE